MGVRCCDLHDCSTSPLARQIQHSDYLIMRARDMPQMRVCWLSLAGRCFSFIALPLSPRNTASSCAPALEPRMRRSPRPRCHSPSPTAASTTPSCWLWQAGLCRRGSRSHTSQRAQFEDICRRHLSRRHLTEFHFCCSLLDPSQTCALCACVLVAVRESGDSLSLGACRCVFASPCGFAFVI